MAHWEKTGASRGAKTGTTKSLYPNVNRDDADFNSWLTSTGVGQGTAAASTAPPAPAGGASSAKQRNPYADDGCCSSVNCKVSTCVLSVLNVLFFLFGGGTIAGVIYFRGNGKWTDVCDWCDTLSIVVIADGAFIVLVALIGLIVVVALRNKCGTLVYAVCMLILFALAVAAAAGAVMLKGGHLTSQLSEAWDSAVTDDRGKVCQIQAELQCSGFDTCCAESCWANGTGAAAAPAKGCPDCRDAPGGDVAAAPDDTDPGADNNYTETCHAKLKDAVDTYFPGILGGSVAFAVFAALCIVLGCRAGCCEKKEQDGYTPVYTSEI